MAILFVCCLCAASAAALRKALRRRARWVAERPGSPRTVAYGDCAPAFVAPRFTNVSVGSPLASAVQNGPSRPLGVSEGCLSTREAQKALKIEASVSIKPLADFGDHSLLPCTRQLTPGACPRLVTGPKSPLGSVSQSLEAPRRPASEHKQRRGKHASRRLWTPPRQRCAQN